MVLAPTCPGYVIRGDVNDLMVSLQDHWNLVTINASVRFGWFWAIPKGQQRSFLTVL